MARRRGPSRRAVEAVYATFAAFGAGDAAPFAALWSRATT